MIREHVYHHQMLNSLGELEIDRNSLSSIVTAFFNSYFSFEDKQAKALAFRAVSLALEESMNAGIGNHPDKGSYLFIDSPRSSFPQSDLENRLYLVFWISIDPNSASSFMTCFDKTGEGYAKLLAGEPLG
jgi:hypothetical protein